MKLTKAQIEKISKFSKKSATSTMDAIHKKMLRNALQNNDYGDFNVQNFIKNLN